jgi:hypothetical protein
MHVLDGVIYLLDLSYYIIIFSKHFNDSVKKMSLFVAKYQKVLVDLKVPIEFS